MALGVVWLVVGLAVLYLFVARVWETLPPEPEYRRRLAGWLIVFAVVSVLYTLWAIRGARSRPAVPPYPAARYRGP